MFINFKCSIIFLLSIALNAMPNEGHSQSNCSLENIIPNIPFNSSKFDIYKAVSKNSKIDLNKEPMQTEFGGNQVLNNGDTTSYLRISAHLTGLVCDLEPSLVTSNTRKKGIGKYETHLGFRLIGGKLYGIRFSADFPLSKMDKLEQLINSLKIELSSQYSYYRSGTIEMNNEQIGESFEYSNHNFNDKQAWLNHVTISYSIENQNNTKSGEKIIRLSIDLFDARENQGRYLDSF